jgi:hypothetical protein
LPKPEWYALKQFITMQLPRGPNPFSQTAMGSEVAFRTAFAQVLPRAAYAGQKCREHFINSAKMKPIPTIIRILALCLPLAAIAQDRVTIDGVLNDGTPPPPPPPKVLPEFKIISTEEILESFSPARATTTTWMTS